MNVVFQERKRVVNFLLHSAAMRLLAASPVRSRMQKESESIYNQLRATYSADDIKGVNFIASLLDSLIKMMVDCGDVEKLEQVMHYIEGIERGEVTIVTEEPTTLDLVLKGNWFEMIESGNKKDEYREIKPFWIKRLLGTTDTQISEGIYKSRHAYVQFRLGYAPDARRMKFKINGISVGKARPEWSEGWPDNVFRIHLGERLL